MRKDMSKVVVERPRVGRSVAGKKPGRTRVVTDDDGEPLRTSKGAPREPKGKARKTKGLNETLNPLKRYLASNVNRPWNKVYSEISEHLKPSSTVQQHVRDHLNDFVATKTRMRAGEVMVTPRFGGERRLSDDFCLYYVHPRTGILRKNEHYKRWNVRRREERMREDAERAKRMRWIDASTQLHLLKDVWWEVKVAKVRVREKRDADGRYYLARGLFNDVVHSAGLSPLPADALYGHPDFYATAKRILSKAEKKKLGL